jgi:thiosulfate/3-mercaptopyruvate sulfurtransferase
MQNGLLVSAMELHAMIAAQECLVMDCRFDLSDPSSGRNMWAHTHIPGAVYADLDEHLASPIGADSGRHPLPTGHQFAAFLAASGWRQGKTVVAYDGRDGAIAARLWWLMHYFGLGNTVLLDGGFAAWTRHSLPLQAGSTSPESKSAPGLHINTTMMVNTEDLQDLLNRDRVKLLDARAQARFAGDLEPLDTVAGHVPGALNHPYNLNLDEDGCFRPADELRSAFLGRVGDAMPADVVHMCGSGVTACHNLLAMELAGLKGSKLYPGSWSKWIRSPQRPVSKA